MSQQLFWDGLHESVPPIILLLVRPKHKQRAPGAVGFLPYRVDLCCVVHELLAYGVSGSVSPCFHLFLWGTLSTHPG